MILPIYIYGQPVLRKVAEDISTDYPGLKQLIADMSDDLPEYKDFRKAYINPHILETDEASEKKTIEEGCLSLPGIHENVERSTRIHVRYLDEELNEHDEWVEGYLARVMQHEFDHLDGKLFIDRISPLRKQLIHGKLKAMLQGRYRCGYKTKPLRK